MLIKERSKSITHLVLESLHFRMNLSYSDRQKYFNQKKGFKGECLFDQAINHPRQNGLILNDLLLRTKSTYYQIDSMLILDQHIFLYETKNFSGAFYCKDDGIYTTSGHLIQNPWEQLNRKKGYLHNVLLNMGLDYSITSFVVFVHPDFYIFSLPPTDSVLFYGQLENHFKDIFDQNSTYIATEKDLKLAYTLVEKHDADYRPDHLPDYKYSDLKKGIFCPKCFSFHSNDTRKNRICNSCGFTEKITDAIYRSTLEFQILFPEMPLTVQNIYNWCGLFYSKYRIRVVLKNKFTQYLNGPKTFYK